MTDEEELTTIERKALALVERFVVAMENVALCMESRPGRVSLMPEEMSLPISSESEVLKSESMTTARLRVLTPKVRDSGTAHGISNLMFFNIAPKIVRLLLRDERSISHGLYGNTIDDEIGCTPERRKRAVHRLQEELSLVTSSTSKPGQSALIKISNVELAKMWLSDVGES